MPLDQQTLSILIALTLIISCIVTFFLWRINPNVEGPWFWTLAALVAAIGFAIYWPEVIPNDRIRIFINNSGALIGTLMVIEGILRFRGYGNPARRKYVNSFLIILFIATSWITAGNLLIRPLVQDSFFSIMLALVAYLMLVKTSGLELRTHMITAISALLMMSATLYRLYLAASGKMTAELHAQVVLLVFVMVLVYNLGRTYGLVMAVYYRINLAQQHARMDVELSLAFEKLISEISSKMIALPAGELDQGINLALEKVARFFYAGTGYLVQFTEDRHKMQITHHWVDEEADNSHAVNEKDFCFLPSQLLDKIMDKGFIIVSDPDELPDQACCLKNRFNLADVKEIRAIPLIKEQQVFGLLCLDTFSGSEHWSEKQISLLNVVAETIMQALERYHNYKTIYHLSYYDQLTGLHNRHFFSSELKKLDNNPNLYPVAIISADLDGLKVVNDTFGHLEGDKYLWQSASLIKKALREEDKVARVGGDEFVVILPKTDLAGGERIVKRISDMIADYNRTHQDKKIQISFGLAVSHSHSETLEKTYHVADARMYKEKKDRKLRIGD